MDFVERDTWKVEGVWSTLYDLWINKKLNAVDTETELKFMACLHTIKEDLVRLDILDAMWNTPGYGPADDVPNRRAIFEWTEGQWIMEQWVDDCSPLPDEMLP